MKKAEFLKKLKFPQEWLSLELYPEDLFKIQISEYEPKHVHSSEHTRNGAFTWWFHQNPSADILKNLALASLAEPDLSLRKDIQQRIRESKNFNEEVDLILKE